MRRAASIASCVLVVAAGAGIAFAEAAAPVRPTAPCAECHEPPGAAGARVVHAPVRQGACLACHAPHASRHPALQRRAGARLCLSCHDALARRLEGESPHPAIATEKACVACHEPHASARPRLLREDPAASCASCHAAALAATAGARPHAPVRDGDCLACHDPHASKLPALARRREPDLCLACHAAAAVKAAAGHRGLPAERARCTACHAPHGGAAPGMIRGAAHAPFAAGECDACHAPDGKRREAHPSAAVCAACHEAWPAGHPATARDGCLACHAPHAAPAPHLIAAPERRLCVACHEEIAGQRAGSVSLHPPFQGMRDCTVCHRLHTGESEALLLKGDPSAACMTCHGAHSQFSHPMGEGVPDLSRPGRSVGCLSCHDPHGTSFPRLLLADPRQDLCLRCHADGMR